MTPQKRSHHRLKRAVAPYLYLSPSLLIIGLLMLLPMVTVIAYSFQN
ncbi:MAG: sugar ABC transporter permease, partial [Mesorhizobium sp.]